jgi:hypothetical protein
MECRTKDELEQHLSDIRRLATSHALTSEEKDSVARAERFAIGLLREHDESGHQRQEMSLRHTDHLSPHTFVLWSVVIHAKE